MESKEIRHKTKLELEKLLTEKREGLRALNFKKEARQFKNVSEIKNIRKDIARILTILKEKSSKD